MTVSYYSLLSFSAEKAVRHIPKRYHSDSTFSVTFGIAKNVEFPIPLFPPDLEHGGTQRYRLIYFLFAFYL